MVGMTAISMAEKMDVLLVDLSVEKMVVSTVLRSVDAMVTWWVDWSVELLADSMVVGMVVLTV